MFFIPIVAAAPLKKPFSAVEKWRLGFMVLRITVLDVPDLEIMKSLLSTKP